MRCLGVCIAVGASGVAAFQIATPIRPAHRGLSSAPTVTNPRLPRVRSPPIELQLSSSSAYEQLMEKLPSKSVIDAVIDIPSDKVIASDVATRAGVSLTQARKDLTALASLSQGDISVSKDGELMYEFPPNLNSVLSSNSAKYSAVQTFEKVWPSVFWGIRVGFGVALLASVVLIFSTLLVVSSGGSSEDDDTPQIGKKNRLMRSNLWTSSSSFFSDALIFLVLVFPFP